MAGIKIFFENLNSIKQIFALLFIIFNFINRDISNFLLILTLLFCLIDYRSLVLSCSKYKKLIYAIILFSLWIFFSAYLNGTPIHELDNYSRLLLLIPILSIDLKLNDFKKIIPITAASSLCLLIYDHLYLDTLRFSGTSSFYLTFANMIVVMLVLTIFSLTNTSNSKALKVLLMLSSAALIIIYVSSGARGPAIGLLVSLFMLIIWSKNIKLLISIFLSLIIFISIQNPLLDRMKNIASIDISNPIENQHFSLRERITYIHFGVESLKENYLYGIGPDKVESDMQEYISKIKINVDARDHLHNDFIDISVKFGIPALLLLALIYIQIFRTSNRNQITLLLLIMLAMSQVTQSQFAHHQAITFFLFLIFVFKNVKISPANNNYEKKITDR